MWESKAVIKHKLSLILAALVVSQVGIELSYAAPAKKKKPVPAKSRERTQDLTQGGSGNSYDDSSAPKGQPYKKGQKIGDILQNMAQDSRGKNVQIGSKSQTFVPKAENVFKAQKNVPLDMVKPPRSSEFMTSDNTDQSHLEHITDQQIKELYKLTSRFKNSPNRGELWLRLAELYVEKAGLISFRKEADYDKKLKDFQTGKSKVKPSRDEIPAKDYYAKAIQLYEWFERDFPKDPKMDQALFFLGFNHYEIGDVKKGTQYYTRLTVEYPNSAYVWEAHFALGEFYFENENWSKALEGYMQVVRQPKARLYSFALYKAAWCYFRLGQAQKALAFMEKLIRTGRMEAAAALAGRKNVNRMRLEAEGLRDIVIFYAEGGSPEKAVAYFRNLSPKDYPNYLDKLAYYYSDKGSRDAAKIIFEELIRLNPTGPKAFDYQYQIVQNFSSVNTSKTFREELYDWIKTYNEQGAWYKANAGNKDLVENSYKLRETTLRNYTLQMHQTAQNSRAEFSQNQALLGYGLYIREFSNSSQIGDMRFFFAELLYDMKKYTEAAAEYKWVVENTPKSKYANKAAINMVLAYEKDLPSEAEMQKRLGTSLDPVPLEPPVDRFIKASIFYLDHFPNSERAPEIKFRAGRLYYLSNQFDPAVKHFREIAQKYPKSQYAEYSANLLLDIYNLKKDYVGLEKTAAELLANPNIAKSKAGGDIREVLEKASFKHGQDYELEKNYAASAKQYETFAKQNPSSDLAISAQFNAGVNYERAGMVQESIAAHQAVLGSSAKGAGPLKPKSRRLMAKLLQDTGQYEEAAAAFNAVGKEAGPKDPLAPNFFFNAAVLYEGLGQTDAAVQNYQTYMGLSKKADRNETYYTIGEIYRKKGNANLAIDNYQKYLQSASDKERIVEVNYKIAELYQSAHNRKMADEFYQKTVAIQRRFAPGLKGPGAHYAAKVRLTQTLKIYQDFKNIPIPNDPKKQQAAVQKKLAIMTKLNADLVEIIKYDSPEEIVGGLTVLGHSNSHMASSLLDAPLPPGLNEEETKQYKAGIEKIAEPFRTKARDSYKAAADRASDLEVYDKYFAEAKEGILQYDPKHHYDGGEEGMDVRQVNWMGL